MIRPGVTRRICVGTVCRDLHMVENGRLRSWRCLSVRWRGLVDWCQPWQFEDERQLRAVIEIRLAGAGLLLMGPVELEPFCDFERIYCVVARRGRPHDRAVRVNRMLQGWQAAATAAATDEHR